MTAVGGLVGGSGYPKGIIIRNSYSSGDINIFSESWVNYIGGIIGQSNSSTLGRDEFIGNHSTGNININAAYTGYSIGGLIGETDSSCNVSDNYTSGELNIVTNYMNEGISGLIGYISASTDISNSYSSMDLNFRFSDSGHAGGDSIGGLVGYANAPLIAISNSFYNGNITINAANSISQIGGLIGSWNGSWPSGVWVSSSTYSAGNITINASTTIDSVGGFIGVFTKPLATTTNSFSTSNISLTSSLGAGSITHVGGFIGKYTAGNVFSNNHYDQTLSGQPLCSGQDGDDPDKAWCGAITDSSSFKGNSNSPIFTDWNFTNTWSTVTGNYPILQNLPSPYPVVVTTYTLTYTADTNGTISGSSTQVVNSGSDGSIITAVPNTGYRFTSWSDASTTNPRTDTAVAGNITVTASFEVIPVVPPPTTHSSSGGGYYIPRTIPTPPPPVLPPVPGCPTGFTCTPKALNNNTPGTTTLPISSSTPFTRDLQLGHKGNDVKALQIYLNTHGYPVSTTGPGSRNHETTTFGSATKRALMKFQKANNIPATGYFGPKTRGVVRN